VSAPAHVGRVIRGLAGTARPSAPFPRSVTPALARHSPRPHRAPATASRRPLGSPPGRPAWPSVAGAAQFAIRGGQRAHPVFRVRDRVPPDAQRWRLSRGRSAFLTPGRRLQPLVGPPSCATLRWRCPRTDSFRRTRDRSGRPSRFLTPKRCKNGVDPISMLLCNRLAVLSDLFNDGIAARSHGLGSISSSGVQMIGGTKPACRHVSSILPRIVALARCRRFQVRR
jgi:hypothetical protein